MKKIISKFNYWTNGNKGLNGLVLVLVLCVFLFVLGTIFKKEVIKEASIFAIIISTLTWIFIGFLEVKQ